MFLVDLMGTTPFHAWGVDYFADQYVKYDAAMLTTPLTKVHQVHVQGRR